MADSIDRARHRFGRLGSTIIYYRTLGSTNDLAASLSSGRMAPDEVEGAVVVADEQTAGRGRRGHSWFSPPGSGLYVSVILTPGRARVDPLRATSLLTLAAGVAIAEAVDATTGLACDLKWPNDLFLSGRKLAGILAEGSTSASAPAAVDVITLGYGINVAPTAYPPALASRATSLEMELGRTIDRALLFVETLAALARRYEDLLAGRFDAILDAWRRRAPASRGARVTFSTGIAPSGRQSGITEGIDDTGALLVRVGERLERIVSGELTWDETRHR